MCLTNSISLDDSDGDVCCTLYASALSIMRTVVDVEQSMNKYRGLAPCSLAYIWRTLRKSILCHQVNHNLHSYPAKTNYRLPARPPRQTDKTQFGILRDQPPESLDIKIIVAGMRCIEKERDN